MVSCCSEGILVWIGKRPARSRHDHLWEGIGLGAIFTDQDRALQGAFDNGTFRGSHGTRLIANAPWSDIGATHVSESSLTCGSATASAALGHLHLRDNASAQISSESAGGTNNSSRARTRKNRAASVRTSASADAAGSNQRVRATERPIVRGSVPKEVRHSSSMRPLNRPNTAHIDFRPSAGLPISKPFTLIRFRSQGILAAYAAGDAVTGRLPGYQH